LHCDSVVLRGQDLAVGLEAGLGKRNYIRLLFNHHWLGELSFIKLILVSEVSHWGGHSTIRNQTRPLLVGWGPCVIAWLPLLSDFHYIMLATHSSTWA